MRRRTHIHVALRQPLKWHGGKGRLARKLLRLMPPHLHYVEPFFGGGAVLLAKEPDGCSEVVNDIDGDLTSFWRVLQREDLFARFQRTVQAIPFSETEFLDAVAGSMYDADSVRRAVQFFVVARQSLAGRLNAFAGISRTRLRRGMNEQVSAWLTAIDGLPAVHARLQRVVILNRDAIDVIHSQDGKDTLFYCDPPYVPDTRAAPKVYRHEMGEEQHVRILETLGGIAGKFMLSGYSNPLYERARRRGDWRRATIQVANHAASGKTKRRMVESVWMNF